jgi:hypothetical protein
MELWTDGSMLTPHDVDNPSMHCPTLPRQTAHLPRIVFESASAAPTTWQTGIYQLWILGVGSSCSDSTCSLGFGLRYKSSCLEG